MKIVIIQGHPNPAGAHFDHALAQAYAEGASAAGHELRWIELARLDVPLLRSREEWEHQPVPESLREAQQAIAWADHLLIVYPLWLGDVPALVKAFLEQVFRPGFAFDLASAGKKRPLAGKSARIVVSMGMPAVIYRYYFGAHSLKSLRRNVLTFVGIKPVRSSVIGLVESTRPAARERWLRRLRQFGRKGR